MLRTQAKADDGGRLSPFGGDVVHGPVVAIQDDRGGGLDGIVSQFASSSLHRPRDTTHTARVEHPDRNQASLLRDTVRARADGAGDVGAVADEVDKVRVRVGVVPQVRAPLKLDMGGQQPSINNVCVGADAPLGVVDVVGRRLPLVGDGPKAPRRVGLRRQLVELPDGVLLHGSDLFVCSVVAQIWTRGGGAKRQNMTDLSAVANLLNGGIVEGAGVAIEALEGVGFGDAAVTVLAAHAAGLDAIHPCDVAPDVGLGLQGDDVLARDGILFVLDWVGPGKRKGAQSKSEVVQAQHDGILDGERLVDKMRC